MAFSQSDTWLKTTRNLESFLKAVHNILRDDPALFEFVSNAEQSQEYYWKYIDYGIRVPVYRTMQWIGFKLDGSIRLGKHLAEFLTELNKHVIKEYTLAWSTLLEHVGRKENEVKELVKGVFRVGNIHDEDDLDVAVKDITGLRYELLACYVLTDHGKAFLPFSIMQAPIIPSHAKSGIASGDLYIFDENLIVDIKKGEISGRKNSAPTYFYSRKNNLLSNLRRISNIRYLYGIRKGIGVVAEDRYGDIHLAIYVPWRDRPLLHMKSTKLPLFIYMNRIGFDGIKRHDAVIKDNSLSITIEAYQLGNMSLSCDSIEAELLAKDKDEISMACDKVGGYGNSRRIVLKIGEKIQDMEKYIFGHKGSKLLALFMTIKTRAENGEEIAVRYPVIASAT